MFPLKEIMHLVVKKLYVCVDAELRLDKVEIACMILGLNEGIFRSYMIMSYTSTQSHTDLFDFKTSV